MRIYLAGRYTTKELLKEYREDLHRLGHQVTSRWLDIVEGTEDKEVHALEDAHDVDIAQILIMCTVDGVTGYKGSYFEMGLAIGLGLKVIMVGPPTGMIFERLPTILKYASWEEFRIRTDAFTLQPV